MNNREKIIYCAGLFDGEGCVSYGEKSGYLQLHLGMKDPESVKFFSETFNLNVTTPFFKKRGYIMYHVGAGNNRAKKILERIIPFLIMKKTKAKHCINKYKTQTRN